MRSDICDRATYVIEVRGVNDEHFDCLMQLVPFHIWFISKIKGTMLP